MAGKKTGAEKLDMQVLSRIAAASIATIAFGVISLLLERTSSRIPHELSAVLFGLLTVYAAFQTGLGGGLVCGAIGWGFLAALLAVPGRFYVFSTDDRMLLSIMGFTLPAVAMLIEILRMRSARDNARTREAERTWRFIADHVADVVMTLGVDGTVQYLNRGVPWSGLTKSGSVGRPFADLLPPEYRSAAKKMLPRALSTGEEQRTELHVEGSDGGPGLFELRIDPIMRNAELFAALAVIRDLSGRLVEEESHQRLVTIVNSSNAAIFGTTADGTITSWNPGARRMYGYAADEIVGKHISALLEEGRAGAEAENLVVRASGGEHIERVEAVHRRKDGTPLDVSLTVSPIGDKGALAGLAVVARDLTARKREDEERRRTNALLAEAERIAHVGSWEWDLAADTMTWTDELFRIYGLEPGSMRPSLAAYLGQISIEDREKVKQAVKKARAEAVPFSFDHRISLPDGGERVLRAHGAVQRDTAGKPARLIVTVNDVTSFRKMETELRAKHASLEDEAKHHAKKLKDTEFRLGTVLAEAPLALWMTDKNGVLTFSEGKGLAAFGVSPGEHVGRSVFDVYKDSPAMLDNHRRALAGATVRGSLLVGDRTVESTYVPLRGPAGDLNGIIGVAVDVTQRG